MAIADTILELNDALQDAKTAITTAGGTVGDTGLAGLATEIATIPSGGGVSRPTTWAEFAAMSSSDMQKVYGVGDRVGVACSWVDSDDGVTRPDLVWQIAGWGTTKKENDNTEYPCVTIVTMLQTRAAYAFDAPETPVAATEEIAQAGIYYFGYDGTSYTALGLSAGDTIPYSDYTAVYKTDVTDDVNKFTQVRDNGWNIYKYSAIRQWLNSDVANSWWQASHVGDAAPGYTGQPGFMYGLDSAFKSLLQRTEVVTAGNDTTDDGSNYSTYDYLFLPSSYEMYFADTPVEGDRMGCYAADAVGRPSFRARGSITSTGNGSAWWLRSANRGSNASTGRIVSDRGGSSNNGVSSNNRAIAACKIILAS